jgi:hypothetical protein
MSAKYLPYFPKPVLDDLVTGKWLPVIGAGMSLNAVVPAGKKMPLWAAMSKELTDELSDFSSTSILDGISACEHEFGRARLIERLSDVLLVRDAQPGNAHKEFCTIPFDIVCTTNFDFLLERQYDLTPRYVYPVVDEGTTLDKRRRCRDSALEIARQSPPPKPVDCHRVRLRRISRQLSTPGYVPIESADHKDRCIHWLQPGRS